MNDGTMKVRAMSGAAWGGDYSENAGVDFGEARLSQTEEEWHPGSPVYGTEECGRVEADAAEAEGEGMPTWAAVRKSRAACWASHVEGRRASGEGRTAYCRRHGLNPAGLYHWERKLGLAAGSGRRLTRPGGCGEGSGPRAGCFPDGADGRGQGGGSGLPCGGVGEGKAAWPFPWPPGAGPASREGVRFLPLGLLPAPPCDAGLTVWVGPVRVEVRSGFDVELLRRVVRALGVS